MTYLPSNIIGNLHIARQAMMSQQAGLNVVGQNVANMNTEGYARKQLLLEAQPDNGGVNATGVKRYVDKFATARLIDEESLLGFSQQKSEVLGHVSEMFNDLQDTGIGAAMDNFFGSLRTLESNSADLTSRQEVLARGDELASTFNRISTELEEVRRGLDDLLRSSVSEVNTRVEKIADLNRQIAQAIAFGNDPSDNQDRRDQLVKEISEHADINFIEDAKGEYTIFLEGGMPLVEGINYASLYINPNAVPGSAEIEYVSPGGRSAVITSRLKGARLGAALDIRDNDIPSYQNDLDQVAYDIVTAINTQHNLGFGMDGVGGRDFFVDPAGVVTNAAANMALSSDVDGVPENVAAAGQPAGSSGDNENAIALANLPEQLLASGGTVTFNEAYATIVGNVGVDTRRANDTTAIREITIKNVEEIRDAQSGVALDEELTFMLAYQRAYQASARVVSTTDEMIQAVLGLKR